MAGKVIRRGLVIAGGGAKGAYSFGCLRALHEAGLAFEAVAATSAGALNGAIWSSGQLDAGERLWRGMTPSNTYRYRAPLRLLPPLIARGPFLVVATIGLVAARLADDIVPRGYERRVAWLTAILAWSLGTALFAWLPRGDIPWLAYGYMLVSSIFLFFGLTDANRRLFFSAYLLWLTSLAMIILGAPRTVLAWIAIAALAAAGLLASMLVLALLSTLTAFTSAPLRRTVAAFLGQAKLEIPFYACLSRSAHVFDPDRQRWGFTGMPPRPGGMGYEQWSPLADAIYVPAYIRVDLLPQDKQVDVLIATAALPFGIVDPVDFDGHVYFDGGLADNEPVAALLALGLDEIWLLALDPAGKSEAERRLDCLDLLRRAALLDCRPPADVVERRPIWIHNDPPRIVPYPSLPPWPRLIVVAPSAGLGGTFDGLLNFTPAYADRLIGMGYRETRERLAAIAEMPVTLP